MSVYAYVLYIHLTVFITRRLVVFWEGLLLHTVFHKFFRLSKSSTYPAVRSSVQFIHLPSRSFVFPIHPPTQPFFCLSSSFTYPAVLLSVQFIHLPTRSFICPVHQPTHSFFRLFISPTHPSIPSSHPFPALGETCLLFIMREMFSVVGVSFFYYRNPLRQRKSNRCLTNMPR